MHRLILNPPDDKVVDHADHNGLNNQKSNIRIASKSENQYNAVKRKNRTSIYKGVTWHKDMNKWRAYIQREDEKLTCLGYYDDEAEAGRAYDAKAIEYFGEFALLNFPQYDYTGYVSQPYQKSVTSKFIGVSKQSGGKKWRARVMKDQKEVYVKCGFLTQEEAARDRDRYLKENNLPYKLNFPDNPS
jgi:hypothetical protein